MQSVGECAAFRAAVSLPSTLSGFVQRALDLPRIEFQKLVECGTFHLRNVSRIVTRDKKGCPTSVSNSPAASRPT
jgi:hypothetical protein